MIPIIENILLGLLLLTALWLSLVRFFPKRGRQVKGLLRSVLHPRSRAITQPKDKDEGDGCGSGCGKCKGCG
ncbi:MAG: hypothetical protein ORO03_00935 [Alphaproteobacteria bacterium]|nr:hypothetical protein [Alphaproteobacteria bacterium]